jgi:nitroreductase
MQKSNQIEHPILELIKNRRSSRAFSKQPIEPGRIHSLFEATRWAPSSTNEQPWLYIYATHDQVALWTKLFDCLNAGNKLWAKDAPLLILSLARKNFSKYSGTNAHAMYDLGGANSFLTLQAVEMGLQVRQMAGFDYAKTIQQIHIPTTTYEPRERFLQQEFVMNRIFD